MDLQSLKKPEGRRQSNYNTEEIKLSMFERESGVSELHNKFESFRYCRDIL
jgi:hypothetical protein